MTNDMRKKKNFSFSRHFPFMKSKDQSGSEDALNVEPIERKYNPHSQSKVSRCNVPLRSVTFCDCSPSMGIANIIVVSFHVH